MSARRLAPTILAGVIAAVYVIVSPPSFDLAAHLLRAKLFDAEGFGLWNNWWYGGHHTVGYSVLFPAISAAITPQLAAGIVATATAALFETLARRQFGPDAWLGALWFGAATGIDLFTGRLAFAFGLLPAIATALALQRRRAGLSCALAVLTALCSPVAALFAALGGAAYAIGSWMRERRPRSIWPGLATAGAALLPVAALAVAFPEGGSEPFTFATLWPIPVIAVAAAIALPQDQHTLRAGVIVYALGCIAAYLVHTPVGSNAARLGPLLAGPLAALLWWRRRALLLALVAPALVYLQWQAPVRDVTRSAGDPSAAAGYYRPLLAFLSGQHGPPFRVEIPFTGFHWEAFEVAPRFPLARGWERQLDIRYNRLFYGGRLTPARYLAWLHALAIRFVAVSDARLDYSAWRETALIAHGLPYLRLVRHTGHWRIYEVEHPTPITQGVASLERLGPSSLTLRAARAGRTYLRVHFTPYWALEGARGCVRPAGDFTVVDVRRPGTARLVIRFSLGRIGSRSPRCS